MNAALEAVRGRLSGRSPARLECAAGAEASVALILAPGSGAGLEVLLMKRASCPGDPWSGHVALPGGRREPEDADRLATAIRETAEETGVSLSPDALLGELDDLSPRTPTYPELAVRPFVFGLDERPSIEPGPEAEACFWVGLGGLRGSAGAVAVEIAGHETRVPAYRAGPHRIWGITYRILASFLEIVEA